MESFVTCLRPWFEYEEVTAMLLQLEDSVSANSISRICLGLWVVYCGIWIRRAL